MKIIRDLKKQDLLPSVATVGFFDGVHVGHQYLINQVKKEAKKRQEASMVITFSNHPGSVMQEGADVSLLSLPNEKCKLLEWMGIDYCLLIEFTPSFSHYSAYEFMQLLYTQFNVKVLFVGYDHRFGYARNEGFDDYVRFGQTIGIEVLQTDVYTADDLVISSSAVRSLLEKGDVDTASTILNAPYTITGKVVKGHQVGRLIGFPTANLVVDPQKLIPAEGVYAVYVWSGEHRYVGMLSIGSRPTFSAEMKQSVEVNILDVSADFYHKVLTLQFMHRLRDNKKFPGVDHLIEQLNKDECEVRKLLIS